MSILSFAKHVLYASDDSVMLYRVTAAHTNLLFQLGWREPLFEKELARRLNQYVADGNVIILNDTVEQHYRKEKISKLSPLDRNNIINRKLAIAFPGYPIRAALPLKEPKKKGVKDDNSGKDHLFLFAAIPSGEGYRKITESIKLAECGLKSFSLLPIESTSLVDKIFDKLETENPAQEKSLWRVLIGQHEGGGLRQIVVKNGQIALTRMTPVVLPEEGNGAEWASDVAQEFESTLSYLSRFGFSPNDGIDVALIGAHDVTSLVGDMISVPVNFYPLTVSRAADLVGIKLGATGQQSNFANPLHAAWISKKTKLKLPLNAKDLETVVKPRKIAFFASFLLLGLIAYGGFMSIDEFLNASHARKNLEIVEAKKIEAERIYQDEIKRKEALGIDITLIQGTLDVFKDIDNQYVDPLPLIKTVSENLQNLKLDSFELSTEFSSAGSAAAVGAAAPTGINTTAPIGQATLLLKFVFPGETKPQDGNAEMDAFANRLKQALPDHKVEVTKNLADLSFTGQLQDIAGAAAGEQSKSDFTAEVTITKEIHAKNSGS